MEFITGCRISKPSDLILFSIQNNKLCFMGISILVWNASSANQIAWLEQLKL